MEVVYQNDFKEQSHHCETLLISCMDFRFHHYLAEKLPELMGCNHFHYDYRGTLGGSKAFFGSVGRIAAFRAIKLAIHKHHVKRIILVDHADCGAYGGSAKFRDKAAEEKFHTNQLLKAREIIRRKFPNLKFILVYQDWDSIKTVE